MFEICNTRKPGWTPVSKNDDVGGIIVVLELGYLVI
jgi:hypothetical protein